MVNKDEDKEYLDKLVSDKNLRALRNEYVKRGLLIIENEDNEETETYILTKFAGTFLRFAYMLNEISDIREHF